TAEVRLPNGTYSAMSLMEVEEGTENEGFALVGDPEINLDQAVTVDMDAREANEITVDVPKNTEPSYQRLDYYRQIEGMDINTLYLLQNYVDKIYTMLINKEEEREL